MPRRNDIHRILIIGSGPIVIGQAAEFDYAGTQACKAMREEGVRSILVNSNPATIMTDLDIADAVYIEPLTVPVLERIIARERFAAARREIAEWIQQGRVKYRETIHDGFASTPAAFRGLFTGENIGKQLVRVSDEGR